MKKTLLGMMAILGTGFLLQADAQDVASASSPDSVMFTAGGYEYTAAHFKKELRFVEFILGAPLSGAERQEGLREIARNFSQNPAAVLQQVDQVDAQMQQLYAVQDVAIIGRMRSALISQIHAGAQTLQGQEPPFLLRLIQAHIPVLAIDPQNMLAFTRGDFEAYLQLMQFNAQMRGQSLQFSPQQIAQMQNQMTQQFYSMPLEQKQSLCGMQVLYRYISGAYNQMSPQQKQQWQAQMMNQQTAQSFSGLGADAAFAQGYDSAQQGGAMETQWPAGVNTKAEKQAYLRQMKSRMDSNANCMNIYYDTMMGTHATMLNTIENFGDTGVYWEYK